VSLTLDGRRILVTGGGSGIGRAVVDAYLEHGARVTVVERSPANAAALGKHGGSHLQVLTGDAADPAVLEEAAAAAAGPDGLDNLTCCVGVFDYYASLRKLGAAELDAAAEETWRLNVMSTLHAVRAAWHELERARGSVTLTLSESAFHAVGGGVLYGASKWALRGVVTHLAADLAPAVRVNGVAPGGTSGTRFGGLAALDQTQTADKVVGRDERIVAKMLLGVTPRPADHAAAYVYLADPVAARITTGTVINTDGGRRV
jgi:NAD(P)-dependent dehydrogenase (short-subunit alcohol dehydrogenase family)